MQIENIATTHIFAHLANSFQKWLALDITYRTSYLYNNYISVRTTSNIMYTIFNFIGDVRDYLDGSTQIFSPAFFANHRGIYLSCGDIIGLVGWFISKTFIMAEIKIGFCAIISNKDLAMLIRRHCAGINIDVGV